MSGSARAMEAHYERFIGTVRARQNEIEKACMGLLQRSFELDRLRKETSNQWRLERRVRRFSRREMARDCRRRFRTWKTAKREFTRALRYAQRTPFEMPRRGGYGRPVLMHPDRIATVRVDE